MKHNRKSGFTILEFLLTAVSLFSGLYFIFWASYLAANYTLARHYLMGYTYCELKSKPSECWNSLTRQIDSLKFIKIEKLHRSIDFGKKTVSLEFAYNLPIIGLSQGIQSIALSASHQPGDWQ